MSNCKVIRGKKSAEPMLATVIKLSPEVKKKIVANEARNCSLSVLFLFFLTTTFVELNSHGNFVLFPGAKYYSH